MMKSLFALYKATAREFLRDRMAILFTVLLPLVMAAFFGMLFSGQGSKFHMNVGLAVEDTGAVAQQLAEALDTPALQDVMSVQQGTRDELMGALKDGKVAAVVVLPQDLTANAAARKQTAVEVYWDKTRQADAAPALSVIKEILQNANLTMAGAPALLELKSVEVENRQIPPAQLYIPSMLAIALLWLGVFGVAPPVVQQREAQILRRIGATPLARTTFMGAQIAWRLTTGLLQGALLIAFGMVAWKMEIVGNPLVLLAEVVLGSVVLIALGLLLAGVAKTSESVVGLGQLVQFPMMFLSGNLFDLNMLPPFLKPVAQAMPLTYLGDALKQTMLGAAGLYPLWVDFAVMGGCAVVFGALAAKLFRWE